MQQLKENQKKRMANPMVPILNQIGISDRDNNHVYQSVVYKTQIDDVIKACRKAGVTARDFSYNRAEWEEEKKELTTLKEQCENKRKLLNQQSTDVFQECFTALMHLKVIRAFIEGTLRFGVSKNFFIGLVWPRKGSDRTILNQMNECLADENLKEYYGEKMDA